MSEPRCRVLAGADLEAPEALATACGKAVLFARRRPGKETPNEDSVLVAEKDDAVLLVVADGAGGMRGGAEASRIAVETLCEAFVEGEGNDRSRVVDGIERAHRRIGALGIGAGTTVAAALVRDGRVRTIHAGDSLVLVCGQRGRRKALTVPHSPVGQLLEMGIIDEEQALAHRDLHVVNNLVGVGTMHVEVGSRRRLAPRDTVVVASDGLFDNLYLSEIIGIVRAGPLDKAARRLADAALARMRGKREDTPSKPDDLSFVLFRPGGSRRSERRPPV